jgi:sorbitol/mannitol transport system permease protein
MATVTHSSRLGNILWPTVAWMVAIVFFFPIFWMVFTSFKTNADAVKPEFLFSFTPTLENYANMAKNYDYWRFATNSVITSTFATLFALAVGVPAAYAMAFDPSARTKDVLVWMLSTKMLPAAAVLYPMTFLTKNMLGIFDTHFLVILVLCLINLPIVIWMLFTYFKEIPKEIIEAGKMDGVSTWGEIKDILIPLAWGASPRQPC